MKLVVVALSLLATLFPCLLLLPTGSGFAVDWVNHLWLISFFGNYYRAHGGMPAVINTPQIVGETLPIFYGHLFYPIMGWLGREIGPHEAVRLGVLVMLGLQFFLVQHVLWSLGSARSVALTIACLVTWATYALTNLYNRSALTEFFAGAWLTCAMCYWFCFLRASTIRAMVAHGLGFALCTILTVGTHPITAWMGVCLFAVLVVGGLLAIRGDQLRRRLVVLSMMVLGIILCMAPWLYATARFQRHLAITATSMVAISGIDQWLIRFSPLPLDVRCLWRNRIEVCTPYLDAQANVPLLVLVAVCLAKMVFSATHRPPALDLGVLLLTLGYLTFCIILSLYPNATLSYLPKPFEMVQFTYRWVNQINLALLVCMCMALLIHAGSGQALPPIRPGGALLCCVMVWAGLGLLVKLEHAYFIYKAYYAKLDFQLNAYVPLTYYGLGAYSTPSLYPVAQNAGHVIEAHFNVDPAGYGTPQPLRIVADQPSMLLTSVQAFPWNKLYVDGQAVPPQDVQILEYRPSDDPYLQRGQAIRVSPGEHVLEYRFEPDRIWISLTLLSKLALATIVLGCVVSCCWRRCFPRLLDRT